MSAVSNGREEVGAWYVRSAMLEYIRRATRIPRRIVDARNPCRVLIYQRLQWCDRVII